MKTYRLTGIIAFFMVFLLLVGCSTMPDEVEVCYDINRDQKCDDDGTRINPNNYIVIDGIKTRVYIKDVSSLTD